MSVTSRAAQDGLSATGFDRFYHWWNQGHAAVITLLVVAAEFPVVSRIALIALSAWVPLAMLVLFLAAWRIHPDGPGSLIPNILTTVRVAAGVALLLLIALNPFYPGVGAFLRDMTGFVLVAALLLVEVTDFFDGYAARRRKTGRFGSTWDMESDAVFAMTLALTLRHFHGVAPHVLAIGLMKYLYVLFSRYDGDPPEPPSSYKKYAKTVAATLVIALIVGLAPVLGPVVRNVGFAVILALQLSSFGWDFLLRLKSRNGRS